MILYSLLSMRSHWRVTDRGVKSRLGIPRTRTAADYESNLFHHLQKMNVLWVLVDAIRYAPPIQLEAMCAVVTLDTKSLPTTELVWVRECIQSVTLKCTVHAPSYFPPTDAQLPTTQT